MKRFFLPVVLLLALITPYLYGVQQLGSAGAFFLSMGGGARPVSLGGAYSAIAEGVQTMYWNPAGIANIRGTAVNFTHTNGFAGTRFENLAMIFPVEGGAVGISVEAFLSGDLDETTEDQPEGTGYTFSCNDYAVGITYGRMMTDKFSMGLTIKTINQNIAKVSAYGAAFDVGGVYNTGISNIRFGFAMRNFGPDMQFSGDPLIKEGDNGGREEILSEPYPLPMTFQGGFAADIYSNASSRVSLSWDIIHLSDQDATFGLGMEYAFLNSYFMRVGYTERNTRGLTFGLGFDLTGATLDYCYEDHKYMPGVHRFAVSFGM